MNKTIQLLGITLFGAAVLAACSDDSVTGGGPTGGSGDGGNPTVGGNPPDGGNGAGPEGGNGGSPPVFPPPPEPGAQIDRMGRPAINTALNGAFVQYDGTTPEPAAAAERGILQDGYNEDADPGSWGADYAAMFRGNLAVIDSVDTGLDLDGPAGPNPPLTNAQACVNQGGHPTPGNLTDAAVNYGTLGLVLPDDRLYVNTLAEDCTPAGVDSATDPLNGFLGVELATLLAMPAGCGGRRPADDVIGVTYSLLAFGLPAGFDDGIGPRTGQHPTTFPYLALPTQND